VVNPVLHNGTQCVHTGGGANLVTRIITTRHWPICNIPEPVRNRGTIPLTD
jgi:hypothetical protein